MEGCGVKTKVKLFGNVLYQFNRGMTSLRKKTAYLRQNMAQFSSHLNASVSGCVQATKENITSDDLLKRFTVLVASSVRNCQE